MRKVRRAGPSDTPSALSTPRISLVEANPRVRPCSRAVRGVRYGGCGRWVPGVGYTGWVSGRVHTGYYPPPPSRTATLVLPGPNHQHNQRFCVHQGTPGAYLAPSAHPGSSHSIYPSWDQ